MIIKNLEIISESYKGGEARVALYIIKYEGEYTQMRASEIADNCFVSISTISRLVKRIGVKDFITLKILLENERNRTINALETSFAYQLSQEIINNNLEHKIIKLNLEQFNSLNVLDVDFITLNYNFQSKIPISYSSNISKVETVLNVVIKREINKQNNLTFDHNILTIYLKDDLIDDVSFNHLIIQIVIVSLNKKLGAINEY